jgi:phosphoribosylglycinamide formyltransferase-1
MPNERRNSTLTRVMKLCLAFPEAKLEHKHAHVAFAVRGKTFVYYLDDHHGDGIVSACFKVGPGENAELVRAEPDRYYMPAYIGPRGWVALRLDVGTIDWDEVLELATQSYRRVAPKRLVERAFTRGSK